MLVNVIIGMILLQSRWGIIRLSFVVSCAFRSKFLYCKKPLLIIMQLSVYLYTLK